MKKTLIISAFPGTGKKKFCENVKDLDIVVINFDDRVSPDYYIKKIKDNIGKVDIIFVHSHNTLRNALVENCLYFTLIIPPMNKKEIYIKRYKDRGDSKEFIDLVDENWETWILQLCKQERCNHASLKRDEFLSDIIGSGIKYKVQVPTRSL